MFGGPMISTRDLSELPDVKGLRRALKSMATLDAILCPDWQYRYYSYNAGWSPGVEMGSMRNGSGDHFFAHFSAAGCWLMGFAHEYPMTPYREDPPRPWPGVLDAVPHVFAPCLQEPAFGVGNVTFCIWRQRTDIAWQHGPIAFPAGVEDPDGSAFLLNDLNGRPETYHAFATDYFARDVDLAAVMHVFDHRPLNQKIVASLNAELSLAELEADLAEIGYPAAPDAED